MKTLLLIAAATATATALAQPMRMPGKPAQGAKATIEESMRAPALEPARIDLAPFSAPPAIRDSDDKAQRVGVHRDVSRSMPLQWMPTADGRGWAARVAVSSPGAAALRAGVVLRGVPRSARLRVQGVTGAVHGASGEAVTEGVRQAGLYWTPITEGATQTIELSLDDAAPPVGARLEVAAISHLDGAPAMAFKAGGIGSAQGCHEDVQCVARFNPALAQAARSVAKLVFTRNGMSYVCTGTLINDGGANEVPYIYTAAHCIDSQAAAATLNTFWFFEAAACGSKSPASYKQLAGGATLLMADPDTDVALLRLGDRAPDGAWFAGWDAAPLQPGANMVGLHHPMGDLKKLSIGDVVTPGDGSFLTAAWRSGSTEGGSSGSGLFTQAGGEYVLRGALRGGSASCTSSGNLGDPSNRDYYSRFDRAITALRPWLSGAPAPVADFGGLWFDPAEPGWGLSITQSAAGRAFVVWYTYGGTGQPRWYVAPEVRWTSAVGFEATLYETSGSPWDGAYQPGRFALREVGSVRVSFGERAGDARITVDGREIAKSLTRLAL